MLMYQLSHVDLMCNICGNDLDKKEADAVKQIQKYREE
ncbi:hypothetical protein BLGI_1951 [Brevibacillus laterosporus GI-9]|nr:hypothetical protein BLGI_1951 [Brevibacillus laterosporus GI-9]